MTNKDTKELLEDILEGLGILKEENDNQEILFGKDRTGEEIYNDFKHQKPETMYEVFEKLKEITYDKGRLLRPLIFLLEKKIGKLKETQEHTESNDFNTKIEALKNPDKKVVSLSLNFSTKIYLKESSLEKQEVKKELKEQKSNEIQENITDFYKRDIEIQIKEDKNLNTEDIRLRAEKDTQEFIEKMGLKDKVVVELEIEKKENI